MTTGPVCKEASGALFEALLLGFLGGGGAGSISLNSETDISELIFLSCTHKVTGSRLLFIAFLSVCVTLLHRFHLILFIMEISERREHI